MNRSNPFISPLHDNGHDSNFASPLLKIITGEFDPLRLQGEAFIDKLTKIQCDYSVYGDYPQAETAIEEAIEKKIDL